MLFSVWSGPRCCSTALMYSFGQRGDMIVHDEPLYAAYLVQTGASRPYREQVLKSQNSDGESVMGMLAKHSKEKHVYAKQMGKFVSTVQRRWLSEGVHFVLVRDPIAVIHSFSEVLGATLEETCYPALCRIVSELRALGKKPVVVLSEDVLANPEGMLRAMCAHAGIDFDPAMLRWSAGPKPYDGVWAPYWYRQVHHSTGWSEPRGSSNSHSASPTIPDTLKPLLHECYAMYALLTPYALQPVTFTKPVSPNRGLSGWKNMLTPTTRADTLGAMKGLGPADAKVPAATPSGTPLPTERASVHTPDARNADMLIGVRDGVTKRFSLQWRPAASISVYDSGFLCGDGLWEQFSLHRGCLLFMWAHLRRLYEGLQALDIRLDLEPSQVVSLLRRCVDANGMRSASAATVCLVVSRGLKTTPSHDPSDSVGGATLVIIPEWSDLALDGSDTGLKAATVHNHMGKAGEQVAGTLSALNTSLASLAARNANADCALQLDSDGFVASCDNGAVFIVVPTPAARDVQFSVPGIEKNRRDGTQESIAVARMDSLRESMRGMDMLDESATSCVLRAVDVEDVEVWVAPQWGGRSCVLRSNLINVAKEQDLTVREKPFTLVELYSAGEVFVSNAISGVTPITEVDGRRIGDGRKGCVTEALQAAYSELASSHVDSLSMPQATFPDA